MSWITKLYATERGWFYYFWFFSSLFSELYRRWLENIFVEKTFFFLLCVASTTAYKPLNRIVSCVEYASTLAGLVYIFFSSLFLPFDADSFDNFRNLNSASIFLFHFNFVVVACEICFRLSINIINALKKLSVVPIIGRALHSLYRIDWLSVCGNQCILYKTVEDEFYSFN